jgi:hypothetical protein
VLRCCVDFGAVLKEDKPDDLFDELKAKVRVTKQRRKRSAAAQLRISFFTRQRGFYQRRDLLVDHKNRAVGLTIVITIIRRFPLTSNLRARLRLWTVAANATVPLPGKRAPIRLAAEMRS